MGQWCYSPSRLWPRRHLHLRGVCQSAGQRL